MFAPALRVSFIQSALLSSMPRAFCCGAPVTESSLPSMMELPPKVGIFLRTTTLAPFFAAAYAAQRPAKPEPTTTKSKVSSQAAGEEGAAHGASVAETAEAEEAAAKAPAAARPRSERRLSVDSVMMISF